MRDRFGRARMIIMDDETRSDLLALGFMRNVFDELLPLDIMNMIRDWIKYEWLYLMEAGKHSKIDLNEVFKDLQT